MRSKNLFVSALIALGLTLTLAVMARAQTAASEAPEAPVATETPVAAEVAAEESPVAEDDSEAADSGELRRLDAPAEVTESEDDSVNITVETTVTDEAGNEKTMIYRHSGSSEDVPLGDQVVADDNTVRELVSIFGNATLDGVSEREVVSIFGNSTVNGRSGRKVVSIVGNTTVNGEVGGKAVAIMGNVTLGPKAVVHNGVVVIGGRLIREEGAVVHGSVQEISFLGDVNMDWLNTWFHRCLKWGRPLAFGQDLTWAWTIAIGVFAMYVFLALLFPRGVEKCVETFEQRPGYSLLAMLLSVLLTPVLVIVLGFTIIGLVLIPFVLAAIFFGTLFGKAVVHAWLGRRITRYFGDGFMSHVAVSTLVGGVIILLLYTVPFLGFFLWKVLGMLGLGIVVYTLILTTRKEAAATAGATPVEAVPPPMIAATMSDVPVATLPRAGFWHRVLAAMLDTIVVGLVGVLTHTQEFFLLWFAAYHVTFWALRGTTIGGVVCGLKVVRLDDRPVDWLVAVVRCLGGFLSFFVIGLGFVWVAFDKERQSWHDKIAGTVIVRMPKGVSLL